MLFTNTVTLTKYAMKQAVHDYTLITNLMH